MDNTISLSQFISTIYHDIQDHEAVLISQPGTDHHKQMQATDRKLAQIERKPGEWYLCISSVAKAEPLRRRKQDCQCVWVVMLDDIGTKANTPPVEPSCILESSEGNFQYLYFITPYELTGDDEIAYFEACNRSMIEAGYGDKGAQGVERVYRLPGSINTKEGKDKFQTQIRLWEPDRFWDLNDLMRELKLEPVYKEQGVNTQSYEGKIPEGFTDVVLDYLEEHGRLGERHGDFFDIKCPWSHEHTSGSDTAGYSPLGFGEEPLIRGFNCFHAHCSERTASDFLQYIGQQDNGPKVRAVGVHEIEAAALKREVGKLTPQQRSTLLYGSMPAINKADLPHCQVTSKGVPKDGQKLTQPNLNLIVRELGVQARLNLQTRKTELRFEDPALQELVRDTREVMRAVTDNAALLGINNTKDIREMLGDNSFNDRYHPFEEWIVSTKWDGHSRLDEVAALVKVADEHKKVWPHYLRKWLIQGVQAVRGWRYPKQVGGTLILAGNQGLGKTTFLESLMPRGMFADGVQLALKGQGHKDSIMTATRFPMVELGELESTFSKSESGAIKAFLTSPVDVYRKPYGSDVEDFPRCTIFSGSVNRRDFLIDETGSRRFWPVWCHDINTTFKIDIAQLWAEVNTYWESGEQWWLETEFENQRIENEDQFSAVNEAQETVREWVDSHDMPGTPMTATNVAKMLNIVPSRANLSLIRMDLERLLGPRKTMIRGVRNSWWVPVTAKGGGNYSGDDDENVTPMRRE